jgi:hypothetical protein
MEKVKHEIVRRRWTPPVQGIIAVMGYALLTFNIILIALFPENIEWYAWVNGTMTLVFYSLIHLGSRMYTAGLNALEDEKMVSVLMALNSLGNLDGTSEDNDGLIHRQGDGDEHGSS